MPAKKNKLYSFEYKNNKFSSLFLSIYLNDIITRILLSPRPYVDSKLFIILLIYQNCNRKSDVFYNNKIQNFRSDNFI